MTEKEQIPTARRSTGRIPVQGSQVRFARHNHVTKRAVVYCVDLKRFNKRSIEPLTLKHRFGRWQIAPDQNSSSILVRLLGRIGHSRSQFSPRVALRRLLGVICVCVCIWWTEGGVRKRGMLAKCVKDAQFWAKILSHSSEWFSKAPGGECKR